MKSKRKLEYLDEQVIKDNMSLVLEKRDGGGMDTMKTGDRRLDGIRTSRACHSSDLHLDRLQLIGVIATVLVIEGVKKADILEIVGDVPSRNGLRGSPGTAGDGCQLEVPQGRSHGFRGLKKEREKEGRRNRRRDREKAELFS